MINDATELKDKSRIWWTRLFHRRTQFAMDLLVLASAFWLAYLLRFDFDVPHDNFFFALRQFPYVVLIQFVGLIIAGVYSFIWRYVGMGEVKSFLKAAYLWLLPLVIVRFGVPTEYHQWRVPLSIILIDTLLAFGGVLGLRVLRRGLYERFERQHRALRSSSQQKAVLLIGAGQAGVLAAREIRGRGDTDLVLRGFVDDDPTKQGSVIYGIKVRGTTEELPRLVRSLKIDHVVITIATASRNEIRRIVKICEQVPVKARIIPGLYEILQGGVEVTRIRDVQIEDLLGREPVRLDEEDMSEFLVGKTVMVTGAGGSIGSELARQTARFQPARLLLVERAEFALFNIDRELREQWPQISIVSLVADVSDEPRLSAIFATHRPQIVLHAAAHKHVPLMEHNASEAVKNNVLGTRMIGGLAGQFRAEAFIMISTDKAVRPTSVMGASKRVAELVVQDLDRRYETRYVAVRFGNVIGSAGSVIPIFQEQIRKGGPLTVTHPDMMRYFMTIPEAAQLVLQAGAMGEGGEIFILDMGQPVKILDLAKDTITLSGLKPFEDIDIVFTGIRPGEKLFEELEIRDERLTKTRHPKIFIGKIAAYPEEAVRRALERLAFLSENERDAELRDYLGELLPESRLLNSHLDRSDSVCSLADHSLTDVQSRAKTLYRESDAS
ncbi:MAG TPA: nucleoside-diphosphate sugar epimerase/dehydratase [Blastocatellia bacterium]|nr:nucleoside-diphosphate sugar epimerase/dehydratase [Blastocatellia bacterium]